MFRNILYRNARARDLLDAFLISAISSLLLVRFYLYLADYPQLGGGSLHIAHMLYGGLFMMIAIVLMLAFLGARARQLAAVIGGVGFGIFIDELGKFITEDNNYFFRPAVGLIYAVFVLLYLMFNFLTRAQKLTSREYQINALAELEEAIAHDLDKTERARIYDLLDASDKKSPVTLHLRQFVESLELTAVHRPGRFSRTMKKVDRLYKKFWEQRGSRRLISVFFFAEVAVLAFGIIYTIYNNVDDISPVFDGAPTYGEELLIGQVVASIAAGCFLLYGLYLLRSSRLDAFEQFRRATLINIYLTQFFVFVRIQFDALPGLALNLVLLLIISFVIRQEIRLGAKRHARGE